MAKPKVTTEVLRNMKVNGEPIAALTAYDFLWAGLLDSAGVDILLVGDSVGTVVQGRDTTLPVTMDQILYHTEMVTRAVSRALVIADMPFMSYQTSLREALTNAGKLLKESNVEAVKLEGGHAVTDTVSHLTTAGIPVMGHLGLTPQSIHKFGSYRVRGIDQDEAEGLFQDALALQSAGAFAIVLEKIPVELAARITDELSIPTLGIGAGPKCDGQILVTQDMVGLFTRFQPRFVRRYLELADTLHGAFGEYVRDVKNRSFPNADESY